MERLPFCWIVLFAPLQWPLLSVSLLWQAHCAGTNEIGLWHSSFPRTGSVLTLTWQTHSNTSVLQDYLVSNVSKTTSSFLFSLTVEALKHLVLSHWKTQLLKLEPWLVACTVLQYSCTQMHSRHSKCLSHTHAHAHQRAFVIQQQPAVIDWSICLCVAYKWATWYSALFIWNQLRQRCCVSACGTRALFLSCTHSLFMWVRERTRENKVKRKMLGRKGCVWAVLCLTACIHWALAQHSNPPVLHKCLWPPGLLLCLCSLVGHFPKNQSWMKRKNRYDTTSSILQDMICLWNATNKKISKIRGCRLKACFEDELLMVVCVHWSLLFILSN